MSSDEIVTITAYLYKKIAISATAMTTKNAENYILREKSNTLFIRRKFEIEVEL